MGVSRCVWQNRSWVDAATRAVIFEFVVYSGSVRQLAVASLVGRPGLRGRRTAHAARDAIRRWRLR
jgi:hypothetical protein